MNKNFVKVTWIGLIAGVCLSAQISPLDSIVAMARCSKGGGPIDDEDRGDCSYNNAVKDTNDPKQQSETPPEVQHRKSAARKVLEGC